MTKQTDRELALIAADAQVRAASTAALLALWTQVYVHHADSSPEPRVQAQRARDCADMALIQARHALTYGCKEDGE